MGTAGRRHDADPRVTKQRFPGFLPQLAIMRDKLTWWLVIEHDRMSGLRQARVTASDVSDWIGFRGGQARCRSGAGAIDDTADQPLQQTPAGPGAFLLCDHLLRDEACRYRTTRTSDLLRLASTLPNILVSITVERMCVRYTPRCAAAASSSSFRPPQASAIVHHQWLAPAWRAGKRARPTGARWATQGDAPITLGARRETPVPDVGLAR